MRRASRDTSPWGDIMTNDEQKEINALVKNITLKIIDIVTTNINLCSERDELRTENDVLQAQLTELKIRYEKLVVLYATN